MSDFRQLLGQVMRSGRFLTDEPMSRHTTFRVGGPADYYVEAESETELADVLTLCRQQSVPSYIVGNGSNLLIGDKGYRGVIVVLGKHFSEVKREADGRLWAGAGVLLAVVAKAALKETLTGMEFASGIPGTVGGAVVMNAGAYGSELADVLGTVRILDPKEGVLELAATELALGYRTSNIPARGQVVLGARFCLKPGTESEIRNRMEELGAQRRSKQPLEYPSAGSTFKRPQGYFAGKLIEEAGLRGFAVGGAQVSEKHCGFVINRKEATAADIKKLCHEVQRRVREQSGVELEPEIKQLGEF